MESLKAIIAIILAIILAMFIVVALYIVGSYCLAGIYEGFICQFGIY